MILPIGTAIGVTIAMAWIGFFVLNRSRLQSWLPYLVSVATGMLIAICFTEFVPRTLEGFLDHAYIRSLLILAGIVIVFSAKRFIAPLLAPQGQDCHHHHHDGIEPRVSYDVACTSVGCIIVCAFFDGFEIATAFAIEQTAGVWTSIALILHTLPEGAMAASLSVAGRITHKTARKNIIAVSGALLLGAMVGVLGGVGFSFELYILPLSTGALIYICLGHLLPTSLQMKKGIWGVAIGLILILAIHFLTGHSHQHHQHSERITETSHLVTSQQ